MRPKIVATIVLAFLLLAACSRGPTPMAKRIISGDEAARKAAIEDAMRLDEGSRKKLAQELKGISEAAMKSGDHEVAVNAGMGMMAIEMGGMFKSIPTPPAR